jgi:hypothetical protein
MPARLKLRNQSACEISACSVHIQEQDYLFIYAIMAICKVSNSLKMMKDYKVAILESASASLLPSTTITEPLSDSSLSIQIKLRRRSTVS